MVNEEEFRSLKEKVVKQLEKELEECEVLEKKIKEGDMKLQSFSGVIEMYNRQIWNTKRLTFTEKNIEKLQDILDKYQKRESKN